MSEELRKASILLRNELGVLDLSQMLKLAEEDKKMDEKDYLNRANDAELFWRNHFEKVLNIMIAEQMKIISVGAIINGQKVDIDNERKLLVAKGFLLGLLNVKDWFEKQSHTALRRFEKEESSAGETIPPVGRLDT